MLRGLWAEPSVTSRSISCDLTGAGQKGTWKDTRATPFVQNPKEPFPGAHRCTSLVPGTNGCVQDGARDVGRSSTSSWKGEPHVPPPGHESQPSRTLLAVSVAHLGPTTRFLGLEGRRLENQTCLG